MKTEDAVKNWVRLVLWDYDTRGGLRANSCHGIGEYFVSYDTPIARYVDGKIEVSTKKYSRTTSRHQGYLRRTIPTDRIVLVDEIKDEKRLFGWGDKYRY